MYDIEETGGAKIGFARATWPFAKLKVSKYELRLNASIIGDLYFRPSDIISIEPSPMLSGAGIKINHRVNGYSSKVIFLTFGSRDLIQKINRTGFLNNTGPMPYEIEAEILKHQASGSFPIKWPAAIFFIVVWNLLFVVDFLGYFGKNTNHNPPGLGAKSALGFAFLFALAILISEPFSRVILKEGRAVKDIRIFLFFMMAITGVMLLVTSAILH